MTQDFTGKSALITGASRGIGAATAYELARRGAHVVLMARTQGALEALDDKITAAGGRATLLPIDLKRMEKIDMVGPALAEKFGALDIFIGNAAMLGPLTPAHQVAAKDWEKVMIVNFMANVRLVHTLDPLLRAAPSARVVFSSTNLVSKPMAYWGPYMASKAALNNFAMIYGAETKKTNIKVQIFDPDVTETDLLREAFPGGFPGKAKTAEQAAAELIHML